MASRRGGAALAGVLLVAAGLLLAGFWFYWVVYPGAPLEEPANPGKTPNPSRNPFGEDHDEFKRELRRARLEALAVAYGLPLASLLLLVPGAFLLAGSGRKDRGAA